MIAQILVLVAVPALLLAAAGFVNEAALDLHLAAGSAAIKAGNPADYPATDLEGNPRPNPPDTGAYQH